MSEYIFKALLDGQLEKQGTGNGTGMGNGMETGNGTEAGNGTGTGNFFFFREQETGRE